MKERTSLPSPSLISTICVPTTSELEPGQDFKTPASTAYSFDTMKPVK